MRPVPLAEARDQSSTGTSGLAEAPTRIGGCMRDGGWLYVVVRLSLILYGPFCSDCKRGGATWQQCLGLTRRSEAAVHSSNTPRRRRRLTALKRAAAAVAVRQCALWQERATISGQQ